MVNPADIVGAIVLLVFVVLLARSLVIRVKAGRFFNQANFAPSRLVESKFVAMATLLLSVWLFIDCSVCRITDNTYGLFLNIENLFMEDAPRTIFTETLWLAFTTLPVFFIGTYLAGVLSDWFDRGILKPPGSMIGAAVFGALVPMCSCGAAPIASSLAATGKKRTALVFLLVAPILSPSVMFMSYGVLGWQYLVARIAGTMLLAFALTFILDRLSRGQEVYSISHVPVSCGGGCVAARSGNESRSGLLRGFRMALELHPYILVGIIIGAAVSAYLPEEWVTSYFSHPLLGLFAASGLGIPVYMCTGEEIPLLQPLLDMGLPLGHAIAFTITGNAICIASYLILLPLFGKKVAIGMVVGLFVGSFLIGAGINLLVPLM